VSQGYCTLLPTRSLFSHTIQPHLFVFFTLRHCDIADDKRKYGVHTGRHSFAAGKLQLADSWELSASWMRHCEPCWR